MYTYEVVTTKVIAEGVTRYEGATIGEVVFRVCELGSFGFITNEDEAKRIVMVLYGPKAADNLLHYHFKITSKYPPKWDCWKCFGVVVFNHKETGDSKGWGWPRNLVEALP